MWNLDGKLYRAKALQTHGKQGKLCKSGIVVRALALSRLLAYLASPSSASVASLWCIHFGILGSRLLLCVVCAMAVKDGDVVVVVVDFVIDVIVIAVWRRYVATFASKCTLIVR